MHLRAHHGQYTHTGVTDDDVQDGLPGVQSKSEKRGSSRPSDDDDANSALVTEICPTSPCTPMRRHWPNLKNGQ